MRKLQEKPVLNFVKRIKIEGHNKTRTVTCPYCRELQKISLVPHLKKEHPTEWLAWSAEFTRLYDETNDLKRVMRSFTNAEGQLVLSWTSIESEIRKALHVNGATSRFNAKSHISRWEPTPEEYRKFATTVWDIPTRGTWSVHQSTYRGNWPPQVPRALIELYTEPGDVVLDPFMGGGTTLIEAWLLGRHALGFDVSPNAIEMTKARLAELKSKGSREMMFGLPNVDIRVQKGDARRISSVKRASIDFICTHPPYGDAVQYTHNQKNDLSQIKEPKAFLEQLKAAAARFFEVLKPGGHCAILIGDIRRNGKLHPLGFDAMSRFLQVGFGIEDIVIKTQNKERAAEFYLENSPIRLRIGHEYLFVFRKPQTSQQLE